MTYEELLEALKDIERAIKMANKLTLLGAYEKIDLEIKLIDLKLKLLEQ
jgi:hypothetical protein